MKLNLQVGKLFGVPIILAFDWLLFVLGFTLMTAFEGAGVVNTFLAIMSISVIVLLHEFGHILTARKFGAKTKSVTLHCYGGIAEIDSTYFPKLLATPYKSGLTWFAGPAVNLVLFGILALITPLFAGNVEWLHRLSFLKMANLVLAVFNLLPFLPLDGGGILLSVLRAITTKERAITIASWVGIVGGVSLLAISVASHAIMMGFISLMIVLNCWNARNNPIYR